VNWQSIALVGALTGVWAATSCGGKVVVTPGGEGGAGGASPSSNDTTTTGPPSVTVGPTTSVTGGPTTSISSGGPSVVSSTGTGTSDCGDRPDFDACAQCCVEENPEGYESLVTIFISHCGCAPEAPCLAECDKNGPEDMCKAGPIDWGANFECTDCLNNVDPNDECIATYYDECLSDMQCVSVMECFGLCQ
jgi:hypothetical protein